MSQMTLKIKKVGMKNPKTKVLGFAGPRKRPTPLHLPAEGGE